MFRVKWKFNKIIQLAFVFLSAGILLNMPANFVFAEPVAGLLNDFAEIRITDQQGSQYNEMQLVDGRYTTKLNFSGTAEINIRTSEKISGLYIIWDQPPDFWSLQVDEDSRTSMYLYGKNGFIHEYVPLEIPSIIRFST